MQCQFFFFFCSATPKLFLMGIFDLHINNAQKKPLKLKIHLEIPKRKFLSFKGEVKKFPAWIEGKCELDQRKRMKGISDV